MTAPIFDSITARARDAPRIFVVALGLSFALGCADRDLVPADEEQDTDSPFSPGVLFAGCNEASDCLDGWCMHPQGEPGFCTHECQSASDCDPDATSEAPPVCLAVSDDFACALDCEDASCPAGMRCEQIEDAEGVPRSLCF